MLSGHTHGRQLATSAIGKRFNQHRRREFTHGYYAVMGRHLYVNRGLSYGQRVLEWCRPEVTVFKLTQQGDPTQETITAPGEPAPSNGTLCALEGGPPASAGAPVAPRI